MGLTESLSAGSVNCWPSVEFDLGAINSAFSALLPAGFYYKTFKWPNWHLFEPSVRRMAGLGRVSGEADPDRYEEIAADAEVLVIGGGLAGLARRRGRRESWRGHTSLDGWVRSSAGCSDGAPMLQIAALIETAKQAGVRLYEPYHGIRRIRS